MAQKMVFGAYMICLLAFFFPASQINISGNQYTQYLLTAYSGWSAFLLVFVAALIQSIFLFRKKKILGWQGCIIGIYTNWFAIRQIWQSNGLNEGADLKNLAAGLQLSSSPMFGLFLLAVGGGLLFALSFTAIVKKKGSGI